MLHDEKISKENLPRFLQGSLSVKPFTFEFCGPQFHLEIVDCRASPFPSLQKKWELVVDNLNELHDMLIRVNEA